MGGVGGLASRCGWATLRAAATACLVVAAVVAVAAQRTGAEPHSVTAEAVAPRAEDAGAVAAAAKARTVLDTHCARCHQTGRLAGRAVPAAAFGNVLDLDALAREPALVRPGQPDLSPLYTTLLQRHFPLDRDAGTAGAEPSPLELDQVRAWIAELPPTEACAAPVTDEQIAETLSGWLAQVGPQAARQTRFVSLVPLYNACASAAELASFRQAVQRVLLGLSWAATPARVETIGDQLAILAFRLDELGWVAEHWELLAASSPHGGPALPRAILAAAGARLPLVRADWLANAALSPPLYATLLGLPAQRSELLRMAGHDASLAAAPLRAALRTSAVTGANRLVERLAGSRGGLWEAHDLATVGERQNLFENPLPPGAAERLPAFAPAPTRTIFPLPNGVPAFAMHDADGRLITGPDGAGGACMACHGSGPLPVSDDMRAHAESDKFNGPREQRDAILAAYARPADLAAAFAADRAAHDEALRRAGVDPAAIVDGLSPAEALARRYRLPVSAARIAAERGTSEAVLLERLEQVQGPARAAALRLAQGLVPRAVAEEALAALDGRSLPSSAEANAAPVSRADTRGRIALALWSERTTYRANDLATLYVQASADCNLTLIGIDAAGKATVLFPNDFEQDNALAAGRVLRLPAADAQYQLRLKERGRQTVIGICQVGPKLPVGIEPDYERQRFTLLGDWRNFVRASLAYAADLGRQPEHAERAALPRRGRRPPARVERARLEAQGRAAISIKVE